MFNSSVLDSMPFIRQDLSLFKSCKGADLLCSKNIMNKMSNFKTVCIDNPSLICTGFTFVDLWSIPTKKQKLHPSLWWPASPSSNHNLKLPGRTSFWPIKGLLPPNPEVCRRVSSRPKVLKHKPTVLILSWYDCRRITLDEHYPLICKNILKLNPKLLEKFNL